MQRDPHTIWSDIQAIRNSSPLIHNITNYVVMEQTANSLLAIGASPVMAHALEEAAEMAMLANGLVLNIGTLSPEWIQAMVLALKSANSKGIPAILDPVGSGATSFRTNTVNAILNQGNITVIRGNASEIISIEGNHGVTKGVDSLLETTDCLEQVKKVAINQKCIVWMSGKVDVITNGRSLVLVHNGHELMGRITGMGCTATAIGGAFLTANPNPFDACIHAAILMGIAGEMAAEKASGPGSFKHAFLDSLYNISFNEIKERIWVETL